MPDTTDDSTLLMLAELKILNRTMNAVAQDIRAIRNAAEKQASELWQKQIAEMYRHK